jgi:hypothetical protein
MINQVQNPYTRSDFHGRYVRLLYRSKKVPIGRALSYNVIRSTLLDMCVHTVEFEAKAREEL